MEKAFSVIIPTFNRRGQLKKCLEALKNQNYENFEVIVVNDASSDGTLGDINHSENLGPSAARNSGIKKAKHDFLAFTDDDCLPDKNWLKDLAESFDDADFIFGETIYENPNAKFPDRIVQNPKAAWPMGNNLAFKKSALEKTGLFDSQFDKYHNEDSELAIRAVSKNLSYKRSKARVVHQASRWRMKSFLASAKNSSVWVLLKRKYPKHYLEFSPPIKFSIINPEDYFYLLVSPVLIPLLFLRFVLNGKRDFALFFAKWPLFILLRRFYIYREWIL